ncbi:hypothetical protein HRI_001650800 [Hibiscus trionum]|uniref:NAB domain-containing protein n=1 Tax=Hibiscus trionum TaxID=183268 RepID=A0A9W7HL57_HIBTR|nr:hypothetical protein HRI_001650800 [Hibiscus trionum]
MDKEEQEEDESAYLSRVDSQVLRQQSHWLQTILSDLDTKIDAILRIIVQDDGETFAKRAEMYYQKRPELIEMVEELQKSYRLLAEKYDQLRSQINNDSQRLQNYVQGVEQLNRVPYSNFDTKSTAGDPDHEIEYYQYPSNGKADGMFNAAESTKSSKMKLADGQKNNNANGIMFQRNVSDGSLLRENEKLWNDLRFKVSELVEDSLSQQSELINRNDNGQTSELSHEVPKKSQSRLSWMKRLFCGSSTKSDAS